MRVGLRPLASCAPDHLWWLNDDTVPEPDALAALLAVVDAVGRADAPPIVMARPATRTPVSSPTAA